MQERDLVGSMGVRNRRRNDLYPFQLGLVFRALLLIIKLLKEGNEYEWTKKDKETMGRLETNAW